MFVVEIARVFDQNKIEYALVGGFAVALHGVVRGTVDVDLIIHLSEKSFVAAEKALRGLGLQSRLPVDAKQVFQFREEYIQNRNLIAWSFYDAKNPARVVDVIITLDVKKIETEIKKINGVSVRIIARRDLIKMKKASGRPQDLADVEALEKLS